MIKYKLVCKNCDLTFDSWFASSKNMKNLRKRILNCHKCNSSKVEKTLMAPKLINKNKLENLERKNLKFREISKKIKEYQRFIKNNFKYVGETLPEAKDLFIIVRNQKKAFMEQPQRMRLLNSKMKV